MICVSIADVTVDEACNIIKNNELSEVRLDKINFNESDLKKIFSSGKTLATYRPVESIDNGKRLDVLIKAIKSGASYVDVEVENNDSFKSAIKEAVAGTDCKVIISYHDYSKTPVIRELEQILAWCFESGADIAKIACQAENTGDAARLLSLYSMEKPVISIGMGDAGKITRIAATMLGAPFTYASIDAEKKTAPGQIDVQSLKNIIALIRNS